LEQAPFIFRSNSLTTAVPGGVGLSCDRTFARQHGQEAVHPDELVLEYLLGLDAIEMLRSSLSLLKAESKRSGCDR